ncbi:capsule biosynthesis GfcC family protein [Pseudomonas sp. 7P_10.2_Bac1]|uniref:capsule biosynthesis GfcC family protein n=1 Tax=Pseudomonas sp. 7P_10.2_Bac1 TaxID=2971614 RepID=UPI0021C9AA40|nr:capsule biosynthesis GfcC family protein [Pseudomonas sp. 7P_10.2_Bac1]MCU1729600.1 capsule biosynthesis GfcC family protein [Pseudomonas sp. 7P_10.2_Bac1]
MFSQAAISVSGDVLNPGVVAYTPGIRLLDVMEHAKPNPESYWLAAAWLHHPLLEQQTRLKVGVLFDLKMLQRGALLNNKMGLAALAAHLHDEVSQLPVTGRKVAVLDPVALEVGFARNYVLYDGDSLIYPSRINTVTVVGAVPEPCTLPYQPQQEARDYLENCPSLDEAEADYIWLIHPDGNYQRVAIAAWNRQDGVYAAAGSTILVPVRNDNPDLPTPDLNEQLAQFLATQPLAEVAP